MRNSVLLTYYRHRPTDARKHRCRILLAASEPVAYRLVCCALTTCLLMNVCPKWASECQALFRWLYWHQRCISGLREPGGIPHLFVHLPPHISTALVGAHHRDDNNNNNNVSCIQMIVLFTDLNSCICVFSCCWLQVWSRSDASRWQNIHSTAFSQVISDSSNKFCWFRHILQFCCYKVICFHHMSL